MSKIIFINDHLFWPVVTGGFILLIVFLWKEFSSRGRGRFVFKVLLSLFAITALALIALKPAIPVKESGDKMVLLTPGYENSQLDSLKKRYRQLKVLDYDPKEPLSENIKSAEVVYILGHGVREYDFHQVENVPAIHLPGKSPAGIVKIKFPEEIVIGDDLKIMGLYRNPSPGNVFILQDPGGSGLDSVMLNEEDDQRFQLVTKPKAVGNFVYSLTEKNPDGEVVKNEPVPVQVEDRANLKILILNNFPTFETKYLKNFLAEAGHKLVVRSQVTRGRFKYEYFNTGRTGIGSLSRETLKPYDLLILDAASLRSLGGSQSKAIENALRDDGLGVFIQPDEAFFSSPGRLINLNFQRHLNNEIRLKDWPNVPISKFLFVMESSPGMESIYESGDLILTGYNKIGQGRIGTTVFSNTWKLVLEGNSEIYRNMWSRMIEQIGKRENDSVQFQQQDRFVFPNEPFHFKIRSRAEDFKITNNNRKYIPVIQDVNFSNLWTGTIWPREPGWQKLQFDTTAVYTYYVLEENNWNSLIAQNTLEANLKYFDGIPKIGVGEWPVIPINPFWFYGLFLICMGGLWMEPKLT